jgi:tRNA(fMet)-specific endonuclease VapC
VGFLLDTNIVSDLVRNPQGAIALKIADVGEAVVCTSIIVAAELRFGAARKGSHRLTTQLGAVLRALPTLPFESPMDQTYGELRATLARKGRLIGPHDLLIATQALLLGHTIVTANVREFSRVPKLKVTNWLS